MNNNYAFKKNTHFKSMNLEGGVTSNIFKIFC